MRSPQVIPTKVPVNSPKLEEFRRVEARAGLLVCFAVERPVELRFSAADFHLHPDIFSVLDECSCLREFAFFSILDLHHRNGAVVQGFAKVFVEIHEVHVVIVQDQSCGVLIAERCEIEFRSDRRLHARFRARMLALFREHPDSCPRSLAQPGLAFRSTKESGSMRGA